MTIHLFRCQDCGFRCFPVRLACRRCGGEGFEPVPATRGRVLGATPTSVGVAVVDVDVDGVRLVASCPVMPTVGEELRLAASSETSGSGSLLFVPGAQHTPAQESEQHP
ncbi:MULTISPECIES: hypothetical protein [Actinomycetes]|uniref:DUF35 domain-containing protein n=2 Tax=Actinomycetes TaxID=1760 RepID=A0ABP6LWJ6_9MICC